MNIPIPNEFDPRNFIVSLYRVALAVLLWPRNFYAAMKLDGGMGRPFAFLAGCVSIHTLLAALLWKDAGLIYRNLFLGFVFPFLTAAMLHGIITRIFKVVGTYETAFRVVAYTAAVNLVSWIPVAGLLMEVYRIYLMVIGLSVTYGMKASRAFVTIVLTLALYILTSMFFHQIMGGHALTP